MKCCFTPFIFEGCNGRLTRIWRSGIILNAFFIGCLSQIILLFKGLQRGPSTTRNNKETNLAQVSSTEPAKYSKVSLIELHTYSKFKNDYDVKNHNCSKKSYPTR